MRQIHADLIVCGGGTAGLPAALAVAKRGIAVAVIEDDPRVGGAVTDCFTELRCGDPVQGTYAEALALTAELAPELKNHNAYPHGAFLAAYLKLFEGLPVTFYTGQRAEKY